ncbi:hypothetical protein U1Q18_001181, partial [Sarracenia purpurea var. burkii]
LEGLGQSDDFVGNLFGSRGVKPIPDLCGGSLHVDDNHNRWITYPWTCIKVKWQG